LRGEVLRFSAGRRNVLVGVLRFLACPETASLRRGTYRGRINYSKLREPWQDFLGIEARHSMAGARLIDVDLESSPAVAFANVEQIVYLMQLLDLRQNARSVPAKNGG
jgi:predicted metal-dependent hydrolase